MRIIARSAIVQFYTIHPEAKTALEEWFWKTRKAEWTSFADMRQTFGSADGVGNQRYVFNIHGNSFRLVAVVKFTIRTVFIRFVGTHAEYDRVDVQNI